MRNYYLFLFFIFHSWGILAESLHLTLDKAVEIGISQSGVHEIKQLRHKVNNSIIREKWREYFPKFGVSYFGLKNNNLNQQDSIYNDLRLNIQQLVYDGGENERSLEIAELGTKLTEEDWANEKSRLELEIRKLYLKILSINGKLYIQNLLMQNKKIQLEDTIAEKRLGFKTQLNISNSENLYKTAFLQYKKFHQDLYILEKELKFLLGLSPDLEIIYEESIFLDFRIQFPETGFSLENNQSVYNKSEYRKQQLILSKTKTEKDSAENYWKPKFFVGGYYGKNSNDDRPIRHETYGVNFSLSFPLGSSSSQTQSNYGVQTDGTGIQRIPGFGPQFVGRGENSFVSSNLQLFDNFSHSRKIIEGEIKISEALKQLKNTENKLLLELYRSHNRLLETAEVLKLNEEKVLIQKESWEDSLRKFQYGLIKQKDVLTEELEFFKTCELLSDSIVEYIKANYEYLFHLGMDQSRIHFIKFEKNSGNSIIRTLLLNDNKILYQKNSQKAKDTPNGK